MPKFRNYTLKRDGDRFDLLKTVESTNQETFETKEVEKVIGYSYSLPRAIWRMACEETDDDCELKEYLARLEKTLAEIQKSL